MADKDVNGFSSLARLNGSATRRRAASPHALRTHGAPNRSMSVTSVTLTAHRIVPARALGKQDPLAPLEIDPDWPPHEEARGGEAEGDGSRQDALKHAPRAPVPWQRLTDGLGAAHSLAFDLLRVEQVLRRV